MQQEFDLAVRINASEAFKRLRRLGLVVLSESGCSTLPIHQAIVQLREVWARQPQATEAPPRQPVVLRSLTVSGELVPSASSPTLGPVAGIISPNFPSNK